jgi:hypothetical protein
MLCGDDDVQPRHDVQARHDMICNLDAITTADRHKSVIASNDQGGQRDKRIHLPSAGNPHMHF